MSGAWAKLKKLKGRGLDELRVRSAQAAHAFAERRGWSPQSRVPSDASFFKLLDSAHHATTAETLHAHFRTRPARFFDSFTDRERTRALLRTRFGQEAEAALLARAERLVAGRFDLLGFCDLDFGSPPDWHLEPLSRKRAPRAHWSRIDYLNADAVGDKKITWELNRHQYFMVLGRAYWRTGDERYARLFAEHLASWTEENPPKVGINWTSSLEVSYRAIAWLWALHLFRDSAALTPELLLRAFKFIYLHARHLETYLSTYFSPNTHLTGEALGLYYIGTALPELRASARWRERGAQILLAELARQVRPDGVYYEQTTFYHRYTTDIYAHFYALARATDAALETGALAERLSAMLDFMLYATRPEGTTPFFGDDDGGRLVWLDERPLTDFRPTLANGAALFARPDYKFVAGDATEETLWLLGADGLAAYDALAARAPAETSRAFPDGGFYIMRDAWTRESNFLMIDCGPHGALNCGHAHADALSFDLSARGRALVIDPGTYTYTGSAELRDYFRSSAAHNALMVDGQSSSIPGTTFQWRQIAAAETRRWISTARFDYFEGTHDGYARLQPPVTCTRSLLFLKAGGYWVVRDTAETTGAHDYEARLHFMPDSNPRVEQAGETFVLRAGADERGAGGLDIYAPASDGAWKKQDGWYSECYGRRVSTTVLARRTRADGRREFVSFLVPRVAAAAVEARASASQRVFEISAVGGRAFVHDHADAVGVRARDLLLVGDGRHKVSTSNFVSDFAWTWARFAGDASEPDELLLIDGRELSVGGQRVVRARGNATRVGYLFARRAGGAGEWQVETDADADFLSDALGAKQAAVGR
ncbi:MAG TPA: alginate lyase family protein [Pyrinomonadaceae bacterium]|nr:alginate lyase family protein [Pyrinomonadaceae bacterium]